MKNERFLPEGYAPLSTLPLPLSNLEELMEQGAVVEGMVLRCDARHDLHVKFCGYDGLIPREEAVLPEISGADREIAVLSRVGKPTCFTVTGIETNGGGKPYMTLSRRAAQEQAIAYLLENSGPGTILPAKVSHLETFGVFVDLGCGVTSLIPLENISVSRVQHPSDRFWVGQDILVVVTAVDPAACRFYLSHKELLGTWMENAAHFAPGEAVPGIVRGVKEYGVFVELAPNLSGLAEWRGDVNPGDAVSVYIKSIRPDTRKIKLQIIQDLGPARRPAAPGYVLTDGPVLDWAY